MRTSYQIGIEGEEKAKAFLEEKGMLFLESRYKTKLGEIDLIMKDGPVYVFVEVKSRPDSAPGSGMIYVDSRKQMRTARSAVLYLRLHHLLRVPARFDVVEINRQGIRHIPNAYQPALPV